MRIISHTGHSVTNEMDIFEINRKEEEWTKTAKSIPEFYADQEIFVTGASGFLGKVLVEKLLRSCGDLRKIYILLRPKKGKSIQERMRELIALPLFEPLRKHNEDIFKKLIPIAGDVSELNLGMSKKDVEQMKNVSIIFHSAASVRFDDTLKYAVFMNTRGTREILSFARTLSNLKVIMHVSTTYSHPELKTVGEVIHEPYVDWHKTIEICEKSDDDLIRVFTKQYINFLPNTYTFTKALAEQIVDDSKDDLPLILFRPSIVISAMKEPFPGWIDNFNGPIGLLIGSGLGIMRTMFCNPNNIADFTPVDVCIKAMIIAAWKRAYEPKGSLPIYNCCTSKYRNATMDQIIEMGRAFQNDLPIEKMLWAPGGSLTRYRIINYIKVIFLQLIPALIIDQLLLRTEYKPFLAKLQRKIYEANLALHYFILNNWYFQNDNFMALCNSLKTQDVKTFNFLDFLEYDLVLYFRHAVLGGRRYLLGEKDDRIPIAKRKYRVMKFLDTFVKTITFGLIFFMIFIKYDIFGISKRYCTILKYYDCKIVPKLN